MAFGELKALFSETEKEYLIKKYESLQTPFFYDYVEGWKQIFLYFPTILMILMLVLGYLISGIFAREFQWKADSILFSSMYGKDKAVLQKSRLVFILSRAYTGAQCFYIREQFFFTWCRCKPFARFRQILPVWKSFYEMTNMEKYILCAVGG